MNRFINYFFEKEENKKTLSSYEIRKRKLFISFSIITIISLTIFCIPQLLTAKYITASINGTGILFLLIVLFNYKYRNDYVHSAKGFIYISLLIVTSQHFVAPDKVALNLMLLPLIIFVAYFILPLKLAFRMTLISTVLGLLSHFLPFYYNIKFDNFNQADIASTNMLLIIISNLVAFILCKFITNEQKIILDDLNKTNESLNGVKESNAALLTVLTHDLANIITVGNSYAKLMSKKKMEDPVLVNALSKVLNTFDTMEQITQEIRLLKSIEFGKKEINLSKVNLNSAIENALEMNEQNYLKKSIKINTNYEVDNLFISAEPVSLTHSIISNIISNAIKFSNQSSEIDIHCMQSNKLIIVKIRDYGIGMPDSILDNLFDPSIKTNREGTNGEKGTGFGMPLLKVFMEKYDAKVEVFSYEGDKSGTEFVLSFNLWVDKVVDETLNVA